jgi:NAD(P)-dependent dehydrogenase (short-subunit alcohol dehydrogenase family)
MPTPANQTALIVGVKGLGRIIATHFAAKGARVICAARSRDSVIEAAAAVDAAGGEGVPAVCDLQDPASLAAVAHEHGPLDLVIAAQTAGGRFGPRPLLEADAGELTRVFTAYVGGTWNLLRAVGPQLTARGRGTFLQIGTSSGIRTKEGWAPLGAAQHALRALVQVAAKEWRARGVHVAYLPIDGGISGLDRSGGQAGGDAVPRTLSPLEIARACDYLHHQEASAWTHEHVLRPAGTDWTAPT